MSWNRGLPLASSSALTTRVTVLPSCSHTVMMRSRCPDEETFEPDRSWSYIPAACDEVGSGRVFSESAPPY